MPRKKSLSAVSRVDVPISDGSTYLSSSRVVKPPVGGQKAKGFRGRKRTSDNPVVDTVVVGDGEGIGVAPATNPNPRKRKSLSLKTPVSVLISDGSTSSSSSHVVKPPVERWKAKGIRGRQSTKSCDNPVEDTVVVGDGDGGEPELCCDICAETRLGGEMIKISERCTHSFCTGCVTKHVETKILENVTDVKCPGLDCESVIEVDICSGFLEGKLLQMWEKAKCEAAFDEIQKYYCPFKECSAMLIVDSEVGNSLKECECPYCHRLFCASCKVPWHWKYTCEQFQSMDEGERGNEDVLVKELAEEKKWGRCPKCKFYVERTYGCPHIICRCRFEFCYGCGSDWRAGLHGGCAKP
ncbi:hypothetical protein MLD38_019383 [Melastoma candidum]|uniref:Uncharacterized protein n=1 Tax=Melastoma candidum TaxID=119954 RepID=A0ACB9QX18_9MYRT|nr:hypothetical protein MLD38_019383 [Melastoma candidum]